VRKFIDASQVVKVLHICTWS